jgi:hypothetical protein
MRVPGRWRTVAATGVLLLAGCGGGKLVATTGTVTLDGQPLAGATVQFLPETPAAEYGHALTTKDGAFRVRTGPQDGVAPGSYRVTVTKFDRSEQTKAKSSVLPALYSSKEATPFHISVPHDGPVVLKLDSQPAP